MIATWKRLDTPTRLGLLVSAVLLLSVFATFRITSHGPAKTVPATAPAAQMSEKAGAPSAGATQPPVAPGLPAAAEPTRTPSPTVDPAIRVREFHDAADAALAPALSAANDVSGMLTAIKSNQSGGYSSLKMLAQDAAGAWRTAKQTIGDLPALPELEHARLLYLEACTVGARAQNQLIDWIVTGETTGFRSYLEQAGEPARLIDMANREVDALIGSKPVTPEP